MPEQVVDVVKITVEAVDALVAAAEEFIQDIESVGLDYVEEDWPDLVYTYNNMRNALSALNALRG